MKLKTGWDCRTLTSDGVPALLEKQKSPVSWTELSIIIVNWSSCFRIQTITLNKTDLLKVNDDASNHTTTKQVV